jgi:hypothetical protein
MERNNAQRNNEIADGTGVFGFVQMFRSRSAMKIIRMFKRVKFLLNKRKQKKRNKKNKYNPFQCQHGSEDTHIFA